MTLDPLRIGLDLRPLWRGSFPAAVVLVLLLLAPVLAYGQVADTVVVRWTAPGDDGSLGTAFAYDLRVSVEPIDEANFSLASVVTGLPSPAGAGTPQRITVRGLSRGTTYYFAIRTQDDAGNWSPISNVARWDWLLDTSPPAAPSGVTAARNKGSVTIQWSANAEADLAGYKVYRAKKAGGPFSVISTGLVTETQFEDRNAPSASSGVWYRVTAVDATGNESAQSAEVELVTNDKVVVQESYPNPSPLTSSVSIPVVVPDGGATSAYVDVLDSGDRRVRRITLGDLVAGRQVIVWNGRNDAGQLCAPGVYRGWLVTDNDRQTIRIVRVP